MPNVIANHHPITGVSNYDLYIANEQRAIRLPTLSHCHIEMHKRGIRSFFFFKHVRAAMEERQVLPITEEMLQGPPF